MNIKIQIKDPNDFYTNEIRAFETEANEIGVHIDKGGLSGRSPGGSFEHASLILQIDPNTLHLIFEYIAALVGIYKTTDYVGEFFGAAVRKAGELAGGEIVRLLGHFWKRVWHRDKEAPLSGGFPIEGPVYLGFELNGDSSFGTITVNNAISLRDMSEQKAEELFSLLVAVILPFAQKLSIEAATNGIALGQKELVLGHGATWYFYTEGLKELEINAAEGLVLTKEGEKFTLSDTNKILSTCRN